MSNLFSKASLGLVRVAAISPEMRVADLCGVEGDRRAAHQPARAVNASSEEGDRRFETYFLNGRRGAPRAP